MANEMNGKRPTSRPSDLSIDEIMNYARSSSSNPVDDSVVDEILRSISEQSDTPVPQTTRRTPASPVSQSTAKTAPIKTRRPASNSYEAAAQAHQQAESAAHPVSSSTGPMPDPAYYAMRDPSQTQSFQPARPTHRDTDRLPTIVEEKPVAKTTAVGKVLTFLVVILVIVALVLGVRMLYILGPSLGLDLPDLTKLPVVSTLVDMMPEEESIEEQIPEDAAPEEDVPEVIPTSITLGAEEITLNPGETIVLTATLDVADWEGTVSWASSDKTVATIISTGPTTAELTYVGEGRCAIAALVPVVPEDGSDAPAANCKVVCNAAGDVEEETPVEEEAPVENAAPAEHVDIKLNTYRDSGEFSLNVGAVHTLLNEPNDKITFASSNESVATVAQDGTVTAKGSGTCTITATDPDGCKVEVICRVG